MKQVITSPTVEIALNSLRPEEVDQVQRWFDSLRRWDEDGEAKGLTVPLESIPDVYLMRTPGDLRVFFRIDGDTVTVVDVTRTRTILATAGVSAGGVTVVGSPHAATGPDLKVK
jgi:hypothetical protein